MLNVPDGGKTPPKPIKWYRKLSTEKGRLEAQAFRIEGDRAIRQVIDSNPNSVIEIVTAEELPPVYRDYPIRYVTESQLQSICHTKTPQGPLAVVRTPHDIYSDRLPDNAGAKVLLLEDIQDPGNVGTLIRTAAAFDFSGVILSRKCADPLSPKCVQSTAGAVLSVWIRRTDRYLQLAQALKQEGYKLIAADLNGEEDLQAMIIPHNILIGLGNEAAGLSDEVLGAADHTVRIHIAREKAESLNVAVCGAIIMYLCSGKSVNRQGCDS
jgi:TrmH family RNA methyltransferase